MASQTVSLDLRGERLGIEREMLMSLPESVLLCLFPNGVVLSPNRQPRTDGEEDQDAEDVYFVDVSRTASTRRSLGCTLGTNGTSTERCTGEAAWRTARWHDQPPRSSVGRSGARVGKRGDARCRRCTVGSARQVHVQRR